MKYGNLSSIRWEPFPKIVGLSVETTKNPILRAFMELGVPRPPQSRTVRDEVIFLLRCASEIEHELLIQYLFAAYSINPSDRVASRWIDNIIQIAKEEMGHLITVQNLLLAIGADPIWIANIRPLTRFRSIGEAVTGFAGKVCHYGEPANGFD